MYLKKLVLLVILILGCSGCPRDISTSDKEIYQAIFDYISSQSTETRTIVVSENAATYTDIFHSLNSEELKSMGSELANEATPANQLRNALPAISVSLQGKFIETLKITKNINKLDIPTNTKLKPIFISESEIERIFNRGVEDSWKTFRTKYAGAQSLVTFSRPAIDLDTDTAIIYIGIGCGGLCGQGSLILLAKLKGKWVVVHEENMWIS